MSATDESVAAALARLELPPELVTTVAHEEMTDAHWAVRSAVLADRRVGELPASWIEEELQVLEAVERVKAWADSRGLAALRRLHEAVSEQCRHLDDDRAAMAGPRAGLTPTALRHESRTAAVDEVVLATGLSEAQVTRRLDLALDEDGRASVLLGALDSGEVGLDRALRVHHDTRGIGPEETRAICTRLLARNADGSVRSHRAFCRELRRQVVLHTPDPAAARAEALTQRTAYGVIEDDGTGTLIVTGEAGRVTAAMDRVDDLARRLRAAGDARTLAQLRSDVALDLVLYGWTSPAVVPPGSAATFVGRPPPARVTLVVPMTTLLGGFDGAEGAGAAGGADCGGGAGGGAGPAVAELPGYGFIGGAQARQLAMSSGSVWRRIVTDPVTGAALDVSTFRYRPTQAMADTVAALDGVCRAPGCTTTADRCDIDHARPWPVGPTAVANLSAKHRRHHNHKTRGTWTATGDVDGSVLWTTASRRSYVTQRHAYDDPLARPVSEAEIVDASALDPPPF
ncbi:MAG: HNH endonuclease [Actinomycetota bacterium]|nr:HNH endonuclease [Actinomycetota bacterium]